MKYTTAIIMLVLALPVQAEWFVERKTDPLTDQDNSSAFTITDNAALFVKCTNDSSAAVGILFTRRYLGTDPVRAWFRFDQHKVKQGRWNPGTTGDGAFVPSESRPAFIAEAKRATRVAIRVRAYSGVKYTREFNLIGFTAAVDKLPCIERLGW